MFLHGTKHGFGNHNILFLVSQEIRSYSYLFGSEWVVIQLSPMKVSTIQHLWIIHSSLVCTNTRHFVLIFVLRQSNTTCTKLLMD